MDVLMSRRSFEDVFGAGRHSGRRIPAPVRQRDIRVVLTIEGGIVQGASVYGWGTEMTVRVRDLDATDWEDDRTTPELQALDHYPYGVDAYPQGDPCERFAEHPGPVELTVDLSDAVVIAARVTCIDPDLLSVEARNYDYPVGSPHGTIQTDAMGSTYDAYTVAPVADED